MAAFSKSRLNEIKENLKGKNIAVIGDMMLDSYFWGGVSRISPEAPVPILEVDEEFYRFGGAANVANNILTMGGMPFPIGVIGNDNEGNIFNSLLKQSQMSAEGIFIDQDRPTTSKTRVIADNQHIVRVDREKRHEINKDVQNKIFNYLKANIQELDGIILQDYNKGVLTKELIKSVTELANENKVITAVDPKFDNFFEYKNVTLFKPNRKETGDALGFKLKSIDDLNSYGFKLLDQLNAEYLLITMGAEGVVLFERGKKETKMPTKARKVRDVSGAGDTVIATITMAMSAGASIYEAAYLSNYAGGIVCGEVGIVPIELNVLFDAVEKEIE